MELIELADKEIGLSAVKLIRTIMVVAGLAVSYSSLFVPSDLLALSMFIAGLGLVLWGCYLWAKLKGRSWAWMFLGLLAPAGLMGLLMLAVKNPSDASPRPPSPPRGVT
jgi:hypothetical protein